MYADHSVLRGPHHRRPQHDLNLTTDLLDECSSSSRRLHTLPTPSSRSHHKWALYPLLPSSSHAVPSNSRSVLDLAVINAASEIVEDIIATGARIKNRNAPKVAEYYGCIRMNELLLKHGAEINEIPVTKMSHFECERGLGTALHETAEHSQDSAVQRLSKMGADTALKNSRGKTALDLARQAGCLEVVNILK
ncbi:hypothetical protein H2248_001975 [Termitomyces sp. 'cryptogamus']|nr:hypothetical protein H2248_001975 [Termitomyces sp. 'cryptogamus']